jgi:cobalt-zinc-cadmium efflux system membrane fusion protein
VKVRVAIDNREGHLRPACSPRRLFRRQPPRHRRAGGGRAAKRAVDARDGRTGSAAFRAAHVQVGASHGDQVEIVSGLKAGERIVVKEGVLLND